MSAFEEPLWGLLAREHPALVHVPIAASLLLPLFLAGSLKRASWIPATRLLAWAGFGGGLAAAFSGLLWARSLDLLAPGAFLPARPGLFATHESLALGGLLLGAATLGLLETRRFRSALAAALLWAGLWGAAGHWGGKMVFPDPDALSRSTPLPELPWATSASPKSS